MPRPSTPRPRVALTVGDPAGIGPEIARAAWEDEQLAGEVELVVIGPAALRPPGRELAWVESEGPAHWEMGRAQRACGLAAIDALRRGADLAASGAVDALVTAPACKEALHLAGERVEGQTELLARWAGVERYEMVGIAGELRVMLLTRHLALREAIARLSAAAIVEHLELFDETLRGLGRARPRLALAGLNPHAGEGGLFGDEERAHLEPAVAAALARGLDVAGPLSPDTVFLDASRGRYDGVLALYHDQAFIPLKLLSGDRGLTLIAGLPYLRISPVHGTAFDIAGRGLARPANLLHAIRQAATWGRARTGRVH